MLGAYHVFNNTNLDLKELISKVASKGGTTEAALKVFNTNKTEEIIVQAISSAANRAKELSKV
jgi:pyrroline-5-carboxylate reductase